MPRHRRRRVPLIARTPALILIWLLAAVLGVAALGTLTPEWQARYGHHAPVAAVAPADPCGAPTGHMRVCDAADLDTSHITWVGGRDVALGA